VDLCPDLLLAEGGAHAGGLGGRLRLGGGSGLGCRTLGRGGCNIRESAIAMRTEETE
jgi:hypothetical protein